VKNTKKLVRDRIPRIMEACRKPFRLSRIPPSRFPGFLRKKIVEEAGELSRARGRSAALNELVDLQELVDCYRRALRITRSGFNVAALKKRRLRGGFSKRYLLEYRQSGR